MNNSKQEKRNTLTSFEQELDELREKSNLRVLPQIEHNGGDVIVNGERMVNLSSNDYLGLGIDKALRAEFLTELNVDNLLMTASSSRLLTGNFSVYRELEDLLCQLYGSQAALVLNSGYHANVGILSAIADKKTLILADKLVHASLIDGMQLATTNRIRFRHNDLEQLERLLDEHSSSYDRLIVVVESIYSMDGDEADLLTLVALKNKYSKLILYVDEAHAFGVRGATGLGCAEEKGCLQDIDILVGTFGKSLASVGAFVICKKVYKELLINKMRSFIFTTTLPPINVQWTLFLLKKLAVLTAQREHLKLLSATLRASLQEKGFRCPSTSHIIPLITGESALAVEKAKEIQRQGIYALPVRPPTVPIGSSRIRISLSANLSFEEVRKLIAIL